VTLIEQVRCVEREIALRRSVYPRWVAQKRMKASQAEHELEAMVAVLATLTELLVAERRA
jgi:hypothetical protein